MLSAVLDILQSYAPKADYSSRKPGGPIGSTLTMWVPQGQGGEEVLLHGLVSGGI